MEELRKALSYLNIRINGNEEPNLNSIQAYLDDPKNLSDFSRKQIDLLSLEQKKLLTKKNLEKAAADFDERQKLEQDVKDEKRKLAQKKLENLGLTLDDLKALGF